ncbi:uncharacterized protein VTP21DRAFT_6728 [Calcarisporiella thermophila]|uniref:uncharacterized protein n=1 Tax=Calcarisporiella thermophila TaxID=911321 RepID=UPI00374326E2
MYAFSEAFFQTSPSEQLSDDLTTRIPPGFRRQKELGSSSSLIKHMTLLRRARLWNDANEGTKGTVIKMGEAETRQSTRTVGEVVVPVSQQPVLVDLKPVEKGSITVLPDETPASTPTIEARITAFTTETIVSTPLPTLSPSGAFAPLSSATLSAVPTMNMRMPVSSSPTQNIQSQLPSTQSPSTFSPNSSSGNLLLIMGVIFSLISLFVTVGFFGFRFYRRQRPEKPKCNSLTTVSPSETRIFANSTPLSFDSSQVLKCYTALNTFIPRLGDEIFVQPGDNVAVLEEYQDGWVLGLNKTRGNAKGMLPRNCLDMPIDNVFEIVDRPSSIIYIH